MNYLKLLQNAHDSVLSRIHSKEFLELLAKIDLLRDNLKDKEFNLNIHQGAVQIDNKLLADWSEESSSLINLLSPWKKGPFLINDIFVDSEWRSDYKWDRIESSLREVIRSFGSEKVHILDVGCNNGYYLFRLYYLILQLNMRSEIIGIDPVVRCYAQYSLLQAFLKITDINYFLAGVEILQQSGFKNIYNIILYMGIIYHRRDPKASLRDLYNSISAGGYLLLESIYVEGEGFVPKGSYAMMKNVFYVPSERDLINWLEEAEFKNIQVISKEFKNFEEQRQTEFAKGFSLKNFLDPNDIGKTVEGYPSPHRIVILAQKV